MKDGMRPVFLLPNDTWSRLITEGVYQWLSREGSSCDERHISTVPERTRAEQPTR
jgi:hypothetical protein